MSDPLPDTADRLLRMTEVKSRVGLGKTKIYALIAQDRFPKPYKITPAAARWSARDIDDWIARVTAERRAIDG